MNPKHIIGSVLYPILLIITAAAMSPFIIPFTHAQSVNDQNTIDMEITEVMYNPLNGGEWIEIINNSSSAVDITTLKVGVAGGTKQAIVVDGTTTATLAAGAVAVIVNTTDAAAFKTAYTYSSKPLYTTTLSLPETNGTAVALYTSSDTKIHTVTYNADARTNGTGMSLHVALDATLTPAPATPGAIVINPVGEHTVTAPTVSVASSVENGTENGNLVFLDDGDIITLRVFHTNALPSDLAAKVRIGAVEKSMTLKEGGSSVSKEFTYTVVSGDTSGKIRYSLSGTGITKTGSVTHNGKRAVIDKVAPSVAFTMTSPSGRTSAKTVTATITDVSPPESVSYKLHNAATCTTKALYDGIAGNEETKTVTVTTDENGAETHTAAITLFGTANNNKYVCMKVTDLAGQTAYVVSGEITGITALSVEISELSYDSIAGGEWIEIVNSGTETVTVASALKIVDGEKRIDLRHNSGPTTIATGGVAVIAKDAAKFKTAYPSYSKGLFTATISLSDTGEEIILQSSGSDIDSVTYAKSDGAYKNGKTLHILSTGEIVEGLPTPGVAAVATDRAEAPDEQEVAEQSVQVDEDKPVLAVTQFDGSADNVASGQNIFFTTKDSVDIRVKISDNDTVFRTSNFSSRVSVTTTATTANTMRVVKGSQTGGFVTYTVHFSPQGGTASDNRVKLSFAITDSDDTRGSNRNVVVVVRDTASPTLENGTTATVLGFESGGAVVVPITPGGIVPGDWLRLTYGGSCGNGLLSFATRNAGVGVPYRLDTGRHTSCTITATDSAGNGSTALTIPTIVISG